MEILVGKILGTRARERCLNAPREYYFRMLRWSIGTAATLALFACPAPKPPGAGKPPVDDTALRIRIARAEARRGAGTGELVELARHGDARALALRGLGRTGGAQAIAVRRDGLRDPDAVIASAAARALGIAAALGDKLASELPDELVASHADRDAVLEALGRIAPGSPAIVESLHDPKTAEAAAYAAGRLGRRKVALDDATRAALIADSRDGSPAIRSAAIYGLARRKLVEPEHASARALVEQALRDRDWRVAVEAERALAGEHGDAAGRDATAAVIARRYLEVERAPADAHVVIEGLRLLATAGKQPVVASVFGQLVEAVAAPSTIPAVTRGWIECLAVAGLQRAAAAPDYAAVARCGHGNLPDHLRLPLLAELIGAGAGELDARRAALGTLLAHPDPRVRAAGLGALAALWPAGDAADHRGAIGVVVAALAAPDAIIAGAAVDAATAIYDASSAAMPDRPALDAAIIARAETERDPELSASLLEVIGKRALAGGAAACRAAVAADPVRSAAGLACLTALGEPAPTPEPVAATLPPVDVASVIGKRLRWHLVTSRGELVVALAPEVAPWAVAAIVELTQRHFYDGLEFHRVVPDFVAQGGDPTMSGTGGPGFSTPAEPSSGHDGTFEAGGIGMADGGKDSGGSQWFVMHAYAPHLDGRYTWVGRLESGQKSADALQIGDKVITATIETR